MKGDRSMEKLYFYACKIEAEDFSKIVNGAVIEEEFSTGYMAYGKNKRHCFKKNRSRAARYYKKRCTPRISCTKPFISAKALKQMVLPSASSFFFSYLEN